MLADLANGGETSAGLPSQTIKRADLYGALRDEALRRGVRIHYGKRLADARLEADQVRALFADGTSAVGELLVGADGLHSRTRKIIDPKAPEARYVGLLNTGGYAKTRDIPGEPGTMNMIFGRRCFFGYQVRPDGEVWWFANPGRKSDPTRAQLAAITPQQWRAELNELFRHDEGPMLPIIAATEDIFAGWSTYDFPSVPTWRNERMVIIGDAAHATSPSSGQGASMAVEDGVMLAKCLRDVPGVGRALKTYESLRRKRVEKIVAAGRRNGTGKAPGPVGRVVRDLVLPPVMRRLARGDAWRKLHDYPLDWESTVAD